MKSHFFLILFLFISCKKTELNDSNTIKSAKPTENIAFTRVVEKFVDSTNFGIKTKNKISLTKIMNDDSVWVNVELYKSDKSKWIKTDSIKLSSILVRDLNAELNDYNNDGLNDIIFTSSDAARGGNKMQRLLLFNPRNNKFISVKNSEQYPNLLPNKKLNCIDALIYTGGITTYFLKLEKDSLIEFAKVDQWNNRIIVETIKGNERKEIKNIIDKTPDEPKRFISYEPLIERKF